MDVVLYLLVTTVSVTSLHTTRNKAAQKVAYAWVIMWGPVVEIIWTVSSYEAVGSHSGFTYCHKCPHTQPQ